MSLLCSDSEWQRFPLVAIDFSSMAANSTSEPSRLCHFLCVYALWVMPLLIFYAVDVPCFCVLQSSWWPSSGCQIPSCCDPSSSRSVVPALSVTEPNSDSLMITSRTAITSRLLCTNNSYPLSPLVLIGRCFHVSRRNVDCKHDVWPCVLCQIQKKSNQASVGLLIPFFVSVFCCLEYKIQVSW